jgi:hypothetical protein
LGEVGLPLTYIYCGKKGGFKAVIVHWNFLEAQQTVNEQSLKRS